MLYIKKRFVSQRFSGKDLADSQEVPYLSTDQMIEVDRAMMEDFKIDLFQMMENAGRNLAHLARVRFLDIDLVGKKIVLLAGTGGNGGGALVAARRLHTWGAQVQVVLTQPGSAFKPVPGHQLDILKRMKVSVADAKDISRVEPPDLIIDGLIGYRLKGLPEGPAADLIGWANGQEVPILSLDVPSGVDATSGTVFDPAICATATMTLALPKEGLRAPGVDKHVGELYLADIGVPPALYEKPPLELKVGHLFAESEIVRLK